jgi:hypothetical protein
MRRITLSVVCLPACLPAFIYHMLYFHIISQTAGFERKKAIEHKKRVLIFLTRFCLKLFS